MKVLLLLGLLAVLNCLSTVSGVGCPPCEDVSCPEPACPPEERGVGLGEKCGGRTGVSCGPGLYCKYRLGMILGEERAGLCEPSDCKHKVCSYRQMCARRHPNTAEIRCTCQHIYCKKKSNLVCGNDGITYPSVCSLQKTECKSKRFIGVDHFGPCLPAPDILPRNPFAGEPDDPFAEQIQEVRRTKIKMRNYQELLRKNRTAAGFNESDVSESDLDNSLNASNSSSGYNVSVEVMEEEVEEANFTLSSFYEYDMEVNYVTSTFKYKNPYPECVRDGEVIPPGGVVQFEEGNPCVFRKCDVQSGRLMEVTVPGCPGYPPEQDFNVTYAAVHGGWSDWTGTIPCQNCSMGPNCENCTNYFRVRACNNPSPNNEGKMCDGEGFELIELSP